jgi:hypothetical protein
LDQQRDDISLVHNFSLLFNYTDIFGCITLISKESELDELEKIFMRSKNEYLAGMSYKRKSCRSYLQLLMYSHYLEQIGKSIESILSSFSIYLIEDYGLKNFKIHLPSVNASILEKIRLIVPEIESILKQYKLLVENGAIDHEILQLSSQSLSYGEIPSMINKKYCYGIGKEFLRLKHCFFSNQNTLAYVKPFENKYKNLYGLLFNENISLSDFKPYQKSIIDDLIQAGYLMIDPNEYVKIKENTQLLIIGMLSLDEVINYWYFSKGTQAIIDSMCEKGLIYFGNTLFSEPEKKYFNYCLNKAEYRNGMDLRNKYAHGSNSTDEEQQKTDYLVLLKILILVLLKIENDQLVYNEIYQK